MKRNLVVGVSRSRIEPSSPYVLILDTPDGSVGDGEIIYTPLADFQSALRCYVSNEREGTKCSVPVVRPTGIARCADYPLFQYYQGKCSIPDSVMSAERFIAVPQINGFKFPRTSEDVAELKLPPTIYDWETISETGIRTGEYKGYFYVSFLLMSSKDAFGESAEVINFYKADTLEFATQIRIPQISEYSSMGIEELDGFLRFTSGGDYPLDESIKFPQPELGEQAMYKAFIDVAVTDDGRIVHSPVTRFDVKCADATEEMKVGGVGWLNH